MRVNVVTTLLAAFAAAAAMTANAQFGLPMQLPENDFVWTWGRAQRPGLDARRGIEDFSVIGSDTGFRCELAGKLSLASGLSPTEMRDVERQLRASLFFIQESTYTMNRFDAYRYIDWAVLDCRKTESSETESELAEREAKARERAERRRERRRQEREE
jgi:hypothetical protein